MERDAGAIIEKAVRRSGISIAELARRIHVDRRSIYYWFRQSNLKLDIIYKIGNALNYDFSADFPNLIKPQGNKEEDYPLHQNDLETVNFWKNKYISLLEKYNELLLTMKAEK